MDYRRDVKLRTTTGNRAHAGITPVITGDPAFLVDSGHRIRFWNRAAEQFTGISSGMAVGHTCASVFGGSLASLCGSDCPLSGRNGATKATSYVEIDTPYGKRTFSVSTALLNQQRRRSVLHLMRDVTEQRRLQAVASEFLDCSRPGCCPDEIRHEREHIHLTGRQREVLSLLAEGVTAKQIASKLFLAETTVRNHIRAILRTLDSHSQLEALARARHLHLVA